MSQTNTKNNYPILRSDSEVRYVLFDYSFLFVWNAEETHKAPNSIKETPTLTPCLISLFF